MAYFQCVKVGGGGTANIVNCTQAEYDALPSSKESDNVLYVVYFDGGQTLDPDYSYHKYGDNDEIIVRVYHEGESDQQILWFFRGWNQTSGDVAIPSTLTAYKPTTTSPIFSANYPNGGTAQDGWIGFYNNNIRAWNQSTSLTATGIMYGVVDINGGASQTNPYVDDPYIYIQDDTATRRIYMNGREYAEFNSGGGGDGGNYYLNTLYSTEEKKIGYWTDGKPLYQKTFTQQLSGVTGSIDISALNAETALVVDGYYDIGVTNIGLNEWLSNGNYSYTHVNNELSPPYIDCYCTWSNSTITVTLQYTKTTDTPETNPQTGGVIYLPTIYSEEEREVGCWVDGKPLYQKTFILSSSKAISANQWNTISEVTLSGNEDEIVRTELYLGADKSQNVFGFGKVENGVLKIFTTILLGINAITIQYTKTADVAGSGTWTPSGELAHHYSTNEQIIGTWIDGKPIYQKTIDTSNLSTNYMNPTDLGIPSTSTIVGIDLIGMYSIEGGHYQITDMSLTVSSTFSKNLYMYIENKNANYTMYRTGSGSIDYLYTTLKYTKTTN